MRGRGGGQVRGCRIINDEDEDVRVKVKGGKDGRDGGGVKVEGEVNLGTQSVPCRLLIQQAFTGPAEEPCKSAEQDSCKWAFLSAQQSWMR